MLETVKMYKMTLATQTKSIGAQKKTRVAGRSLIQHNPDLPENYNDMMIMVKIAELYDAKKEIFNKKIQFSVDNNGYHDIEI